MGLHTVVVALDGSAVAETALDPAVVLATRFGARLHLVRASWHRPPVEEAAYLDDVATRLGFSATCTSTPIGFAANEVTDAVDADVDAVLCLATRGYHGVGDLVIGSVATDILRRTTHPVVLVGPEARVGALRASGPIVLAFDGAPVSRRLRSLVSTWARALDSPVRVVTALHHHGDFLGDQPSGPVRAAAAELRAALADDGIEVTVAEVDGVDAARAIADDADDAGAGLVVAGARASDPSSVAARLSRAVLGTTAERLVRRCSAPVLVSTG
jgi:nucleotide-binding universal stress UspA family protein